MDIVDILKNHNGEPIKCNELAAVMNVNERKIKQLVHNARLEGIPIMSCYRNNTYMYWLGTEEEFKKSRNKYLRLRKHKLERK